MATTTEAFSLTRAAAVPRAHGRTGAAPRLWWRTLVFTTLLASGGCYSYSATSIGDLAPGDEIRARLSPEEFDKVREHLPGGDRVLEGNLVEVTGQSVMLEVPVSQMMQGMRVGSLNQRLDVPLSGITEVELRTLDRPRTYGIAAVAGVVLGYVVWDQLISDTRRGEPHEPPPPPEDRRTVIKIPLIVW